MAATNRKPAEREFHRAEIARRYLAGTPQYIIAQAIGLSEQMVSYDLHVLAERWKQSALFDVDAAKARELAKLDNLEREYWAAWEASKHDKQIAVQKSGGGERPLQVKEAMLRKEGQSGNPAFLAGVMSCIERRCRLLGLDAPLKNEHSGPNGRPIGLQAVVVNLTGIADMDDQ